jgi:hypothetical protein
VQPKERKHQDEQTSDWMMRVRSSVCSACGTFCPQYNVNAIVMLSPASVDDINAHARSSFYFSPLTSRSQPNFHAVDDANLQQLLLFQSSHFALSAQLPRSR